MICKAYSITLSVSTSSRQAYRQHIKPIKPQDIKICLNDLLKAKEEGVILTQEALQGNLLQFHKQLGFHSRLRFLSRHL